MTQFYQASPDAESNIPVSIPTAPPPAHQNASTKVVGGTTSITFRAGGGATTTTTHGTVSASDLTPYGDDDWRSTAKNSFGNPTSKITEDSVVVIDGMSAQVGTLVKAGVLVETPNGFELASKAVPQGATEDTEEETQAEPGAMPADVVELVNGAMDGMSDSTVQKVGSLGIAAAVGDVSVEDIVTAISLDTGMDPSEAAQRFQVGQAAFQSQADHFITSGLGIPADDLQNFYAFCRQPENKGALQTAVQQQVFGNSMGGFKPLVEAYMSNVAPSARALASRGFETKTAPNGEELVRIQGQWMPTKVAAKVGLI